MSEGTFLGESFPVVVDSVEATYEVERQYVCFVKRRPGGCFVPYTEPGNSNKVVVKSLREFLDYEISQWYKAGESERVECRPILKVTLEDFEADMHVNGINSKLVSMLGWNYPMAAGLAEEEGTVLLLTAHPRFQSVPYSFRRVCDDDFYALHFVEQILSLRGGRIVFEEYDSVKHAGECEFSGVSAVESSVR